MIVSPLVEPIGAHPLRLGTLLVQQGVLSPTTLEAALAEQRTLREKHAEGDTRLGAILRNLRAVTEAQLLHALGLQWDLTVWTDIPTETIDATLAQQIPISFAKQHLLMLFANEETALTVLTAEPQAVGALDELRRHFRKPLRLVLVPDSLLVDAINKVYARNRVDADLAHTENDVTGEETEEDVDLVDLNDEAPIIRWVNSVMFHAVRMRASDIHVEPREKDLMVRLRVDGILEEYKRAPRAFMNAIVARIKIMAGMNIAEKRLPQDGRIRRKMAGKDVDMRVATVPTGAGERITIRLLDRSAVLLNLSDLGFGADHLTTMLELIQRPHGIVLVTGPTGSGKTTTLYAALAQINHPDINILTVEDPVEYQLEGISQIQVNPKIDLTFASAIRSFLRHDPDVIMVGEIRDQETAGMAITASLTGHLVFSTIHTNDASGAITRLVDMGIEPFLVTSSLSGVLAQRLVRRLCILCRELYTPTHEELERVGLSPQGFFQGSLSAPLYKTKAPAPPLGQLYRRNVQGCLHCNRGGYSGRSAIYELFTLTEDIRTLALRKADSSALKKAALAQGMRTLRLDGAYKVMAGITSIEEVMMVTAEDQ